jgi:putative copper export protein
VLALEAVVGALGYLVLALVAGALLTNAFLIPSQDAVKIRRQLLRIALALACVFLLVHSVALLVQGAKLAGGNLPSADILTRYVLRTQSGRIWLARAVYAALFLFLALRYFHRGQRDRALFVASLPLVASRSLSGHAAAVRENTFFLVGADAVHLIATALWAGALPFLVYLLIAARRSGNVDPNFFGEALKRFSRLALGSVALLAATGFYQSLTHVHRLEALVATPYGNVLTLKLSLFAGMLLLGAVNFFSTKPMFLRAAQPTLPQRIYKTLSQRIGAEALLGVSILIFTGFLTVLPPATHTDHSTAAGPFSARPHATHRHQHADHKPPATPLFKPADGAGVEIISPKPGQTYKGDEVAIQFKLTKGKRGHHVHAYVDGELMGMFESEKGTLTGIAPGTHVLKLRVVEADHQTELDASDEVEFTVDAVKPKETGR